MGHCNQNNSSLHQEERLMPLSKERHIQSIYKNKDLTGYYFVNECFTKTRGSLREAEREVKREKSRPVTTRTMNENSTIVA